MKTSPKITPLEKLCLKRAHLQEEASIYAHKLDVHVDNFHSNFGSMLVSTTAVAAISKLPPSIQRLLPEKYNLNEKILAENTDSQSLSALLADQAIDLLPLFFKGIKPVIATFLLKRIKSYFFGNN